MAKLCVQQISHYLSLITHYQSLINHHQLPNTGHSSSITHHSYHSYYPSFIIHHILPNHHHYSFLINYQRSTIFHHWPMWWSNPLTLEPNIHNPSSLICDLTPITHHTTTQPPSNVTHKLSTINNQPSALVNHPSRIPIPRLISLITFDFLPLANSFPINLSLTILHPLPSTNLSSLHTNNWIPITNWISQTIINRQPSLINFN